MNPQTAPTDSVAHRPRQSPWPAVSMMEALNTIAENVGECKICDIRVAELKTGDIIAEEFRAPFPHPRFRTSRMDGYAFRVSDGVGEFNVIGGIVAGSSTPVRSIPIPSKHCVRINTGGVVPDEADGVVPVEFTKLVGHKNGEEVSIEITKEIRSGQHIREVGSDIELNELLVEKGGRLGAAEIALLTANGCHSVRCIRRPVVGVVSTGDELYDPLGDVPIGKLQEGRIFDSNRPMLCELFRSRGFGVRDCGIVGDRRELLAKAIIEGFAGGCDVLVFSGGVSMGDKDLLKSVLQSDLDFKIHYGRVQMKPGLPNTLATNSGRVVFGLPGNPVSSLVSAHLFVVPWLRMRAGVRQEDAFGRRLWVRVASDYPLDSRPEYVRAHFRSTNDGLPVADIVTTNQVSSRLLSVAHANLLLCLPPKSERKEKMISGDVIEAIVIDEL